MITSQNTTNFEMRISTTFLVNTKFFGSGKAIDLVIIHIFFIIKSMGKAE